MRENVVDSNRRAEPAFRRALSSSKGRGIVIESTLCCSLSKARSRLVRAQPTHPSDAQLDYHVNGTGQHREGPQARNGVTAFLDKSAA
jgi:hypothetical protein